MNFREVQEVRLFVQAQMNLAGYGLVDQHLVPEASIDIFEVLFVGFEILRSSVHKRARWLPIGQTTNTHSYTYP